MLSDSNPVVSYGSLNDENMNQIISPMFFSISLWILSLGVNGLRASYNQAAVSIHFSLIPFYTSPSFHFSYWQPCCPRSSLPLGLFIPAFSSAQNAFIDFHVGDLSSFRPQFRCYLLRPSLTSGCAILQPLSHYHVLFIAFIWNYLMFCVFTYLLSFFH